MLQLPHNDRKLIPQSSIPELDFVGRSLAIQRLTTIAKKVAPLNSTVILSGETGTGKETFARLIHGLSPRASHALIPVDCAALPEGLFESELFGHVKGAFTGAHRDSLGYLRSAHLGTLFLDEIGELPLGLQAKLLRVLQERRVVPVGASSPYPIDVRLICATNRNLAAMVTAGTFRQDLFFRLSVVPLELPPLRVRVDDIIPLAEHWLNKLAETYGTIPRQISGPVAQALMSHSWPGNIRELYNVIEHAHVLAEGETIEMRDLPPRLSAAAFQPRTASRLNLAAIERRAIVEALETCNYNRTAACRLLDVELRRLNRRIASLVIDIPGNFNARASLTSRNYAKRQSPRRPSAQRSAILESVR